MTLGNVISMAWLMLLPEYALADTLSVPPNLTDSLTSALSIHVGLLLRQFESFP